MVVKKKHLPWFLQVCASQSCFDLNLSLSLSLIRSLSVFFCHCKQRYLYFPGNLPLLLICLLEKSRVYSCYQMQIQNALVRWCMDVTISNGHKQIHRLDILTNSIASKNRICTIFSHSHIEFGNLINSNGNTKKAWLKCVINFSKKLMH